jgi:hypothetical protein
VIVAPIAARLAGRLPHAPMGTLVGGLVVLVNGVVVVDAVGGAPWWLDLVLMVGLVGATARVALLAWRRERRETAGADLVAA